MKKIYTLALAALCAFGAAAVAPVSAELTKTTQFSPRLKANIVNAEASEFTVESRMHKAPAKAQAIDGLDKLNTWSYVLLLGEEPTTKYNDLAITVTNASTGAVTISLNLGVNTFNLTGTYDANAGTLTIPQQLVGKDSDGDIYFYVKGFDKFDNLIDGAAYDETTGIYDGNTVTFAEDELWALGDPNNEDLGWYVLSAYNDFYYEEPYTLLGKCSFLNNMVYGQFMWDTATQSSIENTTIVECDIYSNGLGGYIITDPLKALYAELDFKSTSPNLILDATDPNDVLIPMCNTGITPDGTNLYRYLGMNYYLTVINGKPADPSCAITKTVDGNNVTITIPVNATLFYDPSSGKIYYDNDYPSIITFTEETAGVDNVLDNSNNAPVEYYNLQGMRVENPVSGQLLIKKQGTKATKVLVK